MSKHKTKWVKWVPPTAPYISPEPEHKTYRRMTGPLPPEIASSTTSEIPPYTSPKHDLQIQATQKIATLQQQLTAVTFTHYDEDTLAHTWERRLLSHYLTQVLPALFDARALESKCGQVNTLAEAIHAAHINPDFLVCYGTYDAFCHCIHFTVRGSAAEREVLEGKARAHALYTRRVQFVRQALSKCHVRDDDDDYDDDSSGFTCRKTPDTFPTLERTLIAAAQYELNAVTQQNVFQLAHCKCPFHAILMQSGILKRPPAATDRSRSPISETIEMVPIFKRLGLIFGSRLYAKEHNMYHYDEPLPLEVPLPEDDLKSYERHHTTHRSFDSLLKEYFVMNGDVVTPLTSDIHRLMPDYSSDIGDMAADVYIGLDGERHGTDLRSEYDSYAQWRMMFHGVKGDAGSEWVPGVKKDVSGAWVRAVCATLTSEEHSASEKGAEMAEEGGAPSETELEHLHVAFLRRFVLVYRMLQGDRTKKHAHGAWEDYRDTHMVYRKEGDRRTFVSCDVIGGSVAEIVLAKYEAVAREKKPIEDQIAELQRTI